MKIGVLINPLAGIGGSVALKGSDGADIVEKAFASGAQPKAGLRASKALEQIDVAQSEWLTASGTMGEDALALLGAKLTVVYRTDDDQTSADDTSGAVKALVDAGIDLLMFAGGDGTARDVLNALKASETESLPVVGIPAGCKIHSAVYAVTPQKAGELVALIQQGQPMTVQESEVMDLDEVAYRQGQVKASCYGYLTVPVDDTRMQLIKQGGVEYEAVALQDIAVDVVESMEDDVYYFVGAGTTTAAIMNELKLENSLLGVDVVLNRELVKNDVDEKALLALQEGTKSEIRPSKIIVSIIGGQGHIFGRGNQQFSPAVIRKAGLDNVVIIATNEKLRNLQGRPIVVDTGDTDLDEDFSGMAQVVTGYEQKTLYRIT